MAKQAAMRFDSDIVLDEQEQTVVSIIVVYSSIILTYIYIIQLNRLLLTYKDAAFQVQAVYTFLPFIHNVNYYCSIYSLYI